MYERWKGCIFLYCAQAISEPDERYEAYCASSDFIREHIFPGGHLPSMGAMVDAARGTGLHVEVSALSTSALTT
jgi:cyclopropane fatty-acyl-phospholipid synthase-like methyltransferase